MKKLISTLVAGVLAASSFAQTTTTPPPAQTTTNPIPAEMKDLRNDINKANADKQLIAGDKKDINQ
ncbi:hypothetical protein ABTL90_19250, partial [Acinetobacter baumannii]